MQAKPEASRYAGRDAMPGPWWSAGALLVAVGVAAWVARQRFGFAYAPGGIALDALLLAPLLWLARPALRGRWALVALAACLAGVLVLGHAVKIAFLGMPLLVADLPAGMMLLQILSGWRWLLAVAGLAVWLGLMVWTLRPARATLPALALSATYALALVLGAGPIAAQAERWLAVEGEDRLVQLARRGGVLFLLNDWSEYRVEQGQVASREEVAAAAGGRPWAPPSPGGPTRNVHLVLLESLWDPTALGAFAFSRHPFDPRFLALWEQAGRTRLLVPSFGGTTANAEFEALCGMQANSTLVAFTSTMRQSLPCLPALLRQAGFRAVASHPNHAGFWARDRAYDWIGFEHYLPETAFSLDDMDGPFLADASLFRQVSEAIAAGDDGRPVFNYIVTLGSHYAYERDARKRPDVVDVEPRVPLLHGYANAIAHTSEAFMDWLEATLADDPEALVVAFGDHAPVLGPHPDPYAMSGLGETDGYEAAAARIHALSAMPALVIDGHRGPVGFPERPLYALPYLMLRLLGRDDLSLPQGAVFASAREAVGEDMDAVEETAAPWIRSFFGVLMALDGERWEACPMDTRAERPICRRAQAALARQRLVRADVVRGRQHLLDLAGASPLLRVGPMRVERAQGACGVEVEDWGPREVTAGQPFNAQADGSSAFWLRIASLRGKPELRLNGRAATLVRAGNHASAAFAHDALALSPGEYPVEVRCDGGPPLAIGRVTVLGG